MVVRKQKIMDSLVPRAVTIFFLGMAIMFGLSLILSIIETDALSAKKFDYLDLLFESASAFGTVGVTSANTPLLSTLSHIFIIPAMFLGRVGPATFAISLALRESKAPTSIFPEGKIQIG